MRTGSNIFATTTGIVVTGLLFGVLAVLLQQAWQPWQHGHLRGLLQPRYRRRHRPAPGGRGQYLRPEIMGMVLGAFGAARFSANTSRAAVPPPSPAFCWALWQA